MAANEPTADSPPGAAAPHHEVRSLAKVLGAARALILRVVADAPGLTTSELAGRTALSLASVSEHATTLREAGLMSSQRDGQRHRHFPTSAAIALLDASNNN
ncbi:ArsR/SmtB family transcription factor [Streptomyces melanogenes]|uniref:ArsR/SmtB family transcription factor n=1 Tax=Streptomyces melanogenes TaxID=67326 RepID=UPI0037BDA7C5